MKHTSRFILPILTFLTFGMVTGSVVAVDYSNDKIQEANADTTHRAYFAGKAGWGYLDSFCAYKNGDNWPGTDITSNYAYTNTMGENIYFYDVPSTATLLIFSFNQENQGRKQTTNIEGNYLPSNDTTGYYLDQWKEGNVFNYGTWQLTFFTVKFNANGGTGITADQRCYCGAQAGNPVSASSFTRAGYRFTGWNTEADGSGDSYAVGDHINSDTSGDVINLYAQWDYANGCYIMGTGVYYDGVHASTNWLISQSKAQDATTVDPDNNYNSFTKVRLAEGADFLLVEYTNGSVSTYYHEVIEGDCVTLEWITGGGTGTSSEYDIVCNAAGYYSFYKAKDGKIHIDRIISVPIYSHTYLGDTLIRTDENISTNEVYSPVVPSTPTGYSGFSEWRLGSASGDTWTSGTKMTEVTSLYAIYTPRTYTVTLNRQEGSGGDGSVTATFGAAMPSITVPTRSGYTFGGYYASTGGSGTKYYNANGTSANVWDVASAKTLYAKWTANNYTVTLDKQSGSGGDDSVFATFGSAMPSLAGKLPTRTGYDFDGYYGSTGGSGTKYYNADGSSASDWDIAGDDRIYAKWNVKSFNITYGSNYGGFIDKVNTGYFGQAFYITTNTYLNPGYTWTDGTLYVYPGTDRSQEPLATYSITRATDQESFTMTDTYYENLYIYLEWTRTANQYTVTLDKRGGSGGPNTVTATYYEYLPKGIEFPTKPGCEFDGYWGNKAGTERQYYSEEGYQFAIWENASDGTIYAKWYQFYDFNVAITDGLNLKGTLEQDYISSKGIKYVDVHYPNCDELTGAFLDKRYTITDASVDFEDLCVPVNAAQLTDAITISLKKSDESVVNSFNLSVAYVLNEKITEGVEAGTEAGTKKANLCASIMLYGSCVQVVYNHNMGDLAHNRITDATTKAYVMSLFNSKTLVDDPGDSYNNNDGLFDIATVGSAAGLNTTINYRFYFQCSNEDLENYVFSWNPDVGGKLSGVEWDGEVHTEVINKVTWRYYELTGFKPTDTHDMFAITITKGGKTFTADYSIYAYLYKVYNTSTYSNYVSIAKSLEVYHDTAVAYVG